MHITRIIFISLLTLSSSVVFAQLQSASFKQKPTKTFGATTIAANHARTQQCGPDTVYYGYAKASSLQGLNINTANSADKAGQWFDAPQQMMLYGITFYAWLSAGTDDTVTLTCRVYLAGGDSLPTGPLVATTTVQVDSNFRGGNLNAIEKTALFTNPVLIDYPYVVVIETNSPLNVALVASDWDSTDGREEWLGMASIPNTGWLHGYDVFVSGVPFDADFVFNPIVTYAIEASFTADTTCVLSGGTVDFTNTTNSPVLKSRFYNQYVFNQTPQLIYTWDYDDNSPLDLLVDTLHTFGAGTDYDVTLRSNIVGWSSVCQESITTVINPATTGGFTFSNNVLTTQFTNSSSGYLHCLWSFGDGNTSTEVNPTHIYGTEGNFEVTLVAVGECSNDTVQALVQVCNPLSSGFTFTTSGLSADFSVASITGSASFSWDYGDSTSGSGITASHTYGSPGAYSVCLVASNSCNADTTCQQVTVLSTGIAAREGVDWEVFPNPARDALILYFKGNLQIPEEISLVDSKGSAIQTWVPSASPSNKIVLPLRDIPGGTYQLVTKFAENSYSGKTIIIR